jgi:hypothetical protein
MLTKKYFFCLMVFIQQSCGSDTALQEGTSNSIVGNWAFAYLIKTPTAQGKWSDWTQINTLLAVPMLSFTDGGSILYDSKPATTCCNYLTYQQSNTTIKLLQATNSPDCALTLCARCETWKIIYLDSNTLELEQCGVINKYNRVKN